MNVIVERIDGVVMQIMPDMTRQSMVDETDWTRLNTMTEDEIEIAAFTDSDNPPLTEIELKKLRPVPNPKEIRQRLHMTQQEFAAKFELPLGTLRDWEQGAREPDSAAKSYLRVIEKCPQVVMQALK